MFKSPISTKPFLSRSIFAKELLRDSKKLASFKFGGLYVAATKSGLHFGLSMLIHNNSSLFAASSFLTVKRILSLIYRKTPPPFNFADAMRSFRTTEYPGVVTSQSDIFGESQVSLSTSTSKM